MVVEETRVIANNIEDFIDVPDGINRLRKALLTLAVSGKLAPQDSKEGTAEALYKQILDEKEKLELTTNTRKKKIVELKPITADEIPFEIPESWKWVRLGDIFINNDSKRIPVRKADRKPGPYPYYGASGVQDNIDKYIFTGNQLLIGEDGAKWGAGDSTAYVVDGKYWVNNHCHVIQAPVGSEVTHTYVSYLINSYSLIEMGYVRGMTVQKLSQTNLNLIPVALPPLAEQKRIVKKVDEVMKIIDELEAKKKERDTARSSLAVSAFKSLGVNDSSIALENITELVRNIDDVKELEKGILSLAVSGKLIPQDSKEGTAENLYEKIQEERTKEAKKTGKRLKPLPPINAGEIPFEIPALWKWVRVGNILQISSGSALSAKQMVSGNIPVFGGNGIAGYHNVSNTKENTLVIGRVGAQCGNVHITETDTWVTDNAFVVHFLSEAINYNFLAMALRQLDLGSTYRGAAQPVISGLSVYPILFALPPLAEQKRIVEKVDELMLLTNELKSTLNV